MTPSIFRILAVVGALALGAACSSDDEASGSGGSAGAGGNAGAGGGCSAARAELLGPVDSISSGGVTVVDDAGGVKTLLIDATAGGFAAAKENPYIYVRLSNSAQVAVTDPEADGSLEWDLALKRDVIRTNGADSGPGSAGAAKLTKAFADVTSADVAGATFVLDEFLDAECEPLIDPTGKPLTAMADWYDYDSGAMTLSPKPLTFIVRAADGQTHYKLEILDYYLAPEAGPKVSANYTIRIATL